jgi:hypothetical protein
MTGIDKMIKGQRLVEEHTERYWLIGKWQLDNSGCQLGNARHS